MSKEGKPPPEQEHKSTVASEMETRTSHTLNTIGKSRAVMHNSEHSIKTSQRLIDRPPGSETA
jgi:hypothetical protein